jgi:hypothetical protein
MKPPKNLNKYLDGKLPLPAGFVPLQARSSGHLSGVCAKNGWANYSTRFKSGVTPHSMQATEQARVFESIITTLGGTSAKAAAAIGVSPRTVESWRCGRKRLTVEKAYVIAQAMANH